LYFCIIAIRQYLVCPRFPRMIVVFEENVNYAASDKIRIVFKGQDGIRT